MLFCDSSKNSLVLFRRLRQPNNPLYARRRIHLKIKQKEVLSSPNKNKAVVSFNETAVNALN